MAIEFAPRVPWLPKHDATWTTEEESAAEFDRRIGRHASGDTSRCDGPFERVFVEVAGFYLSHRPNRELKTARIDRILLPGPALKALGWRNPIGVELKKSDGDFGAAVSQAIDYTYCTWNVGDYWIYCEKIFLWPFEMPGGPLASVMIQNGIGACHGRFYSTKYANVSPERDWKLNFRLERNNLTIGTDNRIDECFPWNSGHKKGSR